MNINNIKILRDAEVRRVNGGMPKERKFNMAYFIKPSEETRFDDSFTLDEIRDGDCESECCLAGDTILELGDPCEFMIANTAIEGVMLYRNGITTTFVEEAALLLGLTMPEARHMFFGYWITSRPDSSNTLSPGNEDYLILDKQGAYKQDDLTDIQRAIEYLDQVIKTGSVFWSENIWIPGDYTPYEPEVEFEAQ